MAQFFCGQDRGGLYDGIAEKPRHRAEAWGVIKTLSADEEARLLAESREKGLRDFYDMYDGAYRDGRREGKQEGWQEGRQEGRQEGEQQERMKLARNALRKKLSAETIAELTGLSRSEIERLAGEL